MQNGLSLTQHFPFIIKRLANFKDNFFELCHLRAKMEFFGAYIWFFVNNSVYCLDKVQPLSAGNPYLSQMNRFVISTGIIVSLLTDQK